LAVDEPKLAVCKLRNSLCQVVYAALSPIAGILRQGFDVALSLCDTRAMNALFGSLKLVDVSGTLIIAVIVLLMGLGVVASIAARARYAAIMHDLKADAQPGCVFKFNVLARAVGDVEQAIRRLPVGASAENINVQAIVERAMQLDLRGLLMTERFIKVNAGLLITLGLVGTFYGLTASIGKLVNIVSSDFSPQADVAEPLTRGLTDALSGMSVAFTTSLAGICAAILMTLLGVFVSVPERRAAFTLKLALHLDRMVSDWEASRPAQGMDATLQVAAQLDQAVQVLQQTVVRFEGALSQFADNTRDFHEFNAHLKDNIQRMSLSFADLTGALKNQPPRTRPGVGK